ncbi:helix-turn-helix transcriptional regulator [Microbacterium laevaniformans]|uniref:helix-turn-helix domain-containing protein n=1 Tax=Microbacterium TaxID=33882 RepID=UPI00195F09FF|nr:helix-turn-helix transcriptional regulator [Microbacterium laevaniformans]MBM7754094.1 transcriptional regulator with XRE-family HTH domain [Microbacterium laevaniformans]GLJ65842.1 transcriptional regulator [Microbacterium laevaniformans]
MDKRGPLNRTLGENLRLLRHARGRSQQEFAHDLGYDRTYLSSVERGERNLTLDSVSKLADQLGVEPLDLLQDVRPS